VAISGAVDHHAQPVHLPNHVSTERRQSAVQRIQRFMDAARVGPAGVEGVRQRQVGRPAAAKGAQRIDRVFDQVPAFDGDGDGDSPGRVGAADVVRRSRGGEIVGMALNHRVDAIHLIVGGADAGAGLDRTGGVHRKEHRRHAALPHPGDVDVAVAVALADVPPRVGQALRGVDVGVDDRAAPVQAPGASEIVRVDRGHGFGF